MKMTFLFFLAVSLADATEIAAMPAQGFGDSAALRDFIDRDDGKAKGNVLKRFELRTGIYWVAIRHAALGGDFEELSIFRESESKKLRMVLQLPFSNGEFQMEADAEKIVISRYNGVKKEHEKFMIFNGAAKE